MKIENVHFESSKILFVRLWESVYQFQNTTLDGKTIEELRTYTVVVSSLYAYSLKLYGKWHIT